MNRILATARFARPVNGIFASIMQQIGQTVRMNTDARRIDSMPRDRLEDMGIAPRTAANTRTSGDTGPLHRPALW